MKRSSYFDVLLTLTLILFCCAVAPIVRAETLYVETYRGEPGFPTNPEVDVLGLGGMGTASNGFGAVQPPLPALTGAGVSAQVVSTGTPGTLETASTYVDAKSLLAANLPFEVTGHFENLNVSREAGTVGFVAMLLYSSTTGYAVSASLFLSTDGTSLYPSINIGDLPPGLPPIVHSQFLPSIPVTTQGFDLTLVVDPLTQTLNTRLDIAGLRYELLPLVLNAATFARFQPDTLTQTLGVDNRNGAGHSAAVDYRGFRVTTPLIHADIDVKPADPKNVVSQRSKVTPVAVFSSAEFDATTIAPATLTLAGAPVPQSRNGQFLCSAALVNRDRRKDLLCLVVTSAVDAPLGESDVTLNAFTTDGAPVGGEDHIRMIR
jgi:hypothetical protein